MAFLCWVGCFYSLSGTNTSVYCFDRGWEFYHTNSGTLHSWSKRDRFNNIHAKGQGKAMRNSTHDKGNWPIKQQSMSGYLVFSKMEARMVHPKKYSGSNLHVDEATLVPMRNISVNILWADQQRKLGWSLRQQPTVNEDGWEAKSHSLLLWYGTVNMG